MSEEKLEDNKIKATVNQTENRSNDEKKRDLETDKYSTISTKAAYFATLQQWVKQANASHNAMALFPWYLINTYPQVFQPNMMGGWRGHQIHPPAHPILNPFFNQQQQQQQQHQQTAAALNNNGGGGGGGGIGGIGGIGNTFGLRILSERAQTNMIMDIGGYEYKVAPFWKRAIAELIDIKILLIIKIILIFLAWNLFDLQLLLDIDKEIVRKVVKDEIDNDVFTYSMEFFAFSTDVLILEMITKIVVCFYEAIWTAKFNGATPGKYIMGLSVRYIEAMYTMPQNNIPPALPLQRIIVFLRAREPLLALLYPAETPNFKRSFLRAVAKNMITSLLSPMYFLILIVKNHRTVYDIMTKTIVVETPTLPPNLIRIN